MKKKTITEKTVERMAESVALFKGQPWSWPEFNALKNTIRHNLKEEGATEKQLKKFDRIIDEAPIASGSFNTFSGD